MLNFQITNISHLMTDQYKIQCNNPINASKKIFDFVEFLKETFKNKECLCHNCQGRMNFKAMKPRHV